MFKKLLLFLVLIAGMFLAVERSLAANIYIYTDKTTLTENETVAATVYVDTAGKAINNAEAIVNFPKDMLVVESLSNAPSIFNIWVETPVFSNSSGKISFNGGVSNPGFNGSRGSVLKIFFRAKKSGSATIFFDSATIRLNDGLGTDATDSKIGTTITIKPLQKVVEPPVVTRNEESANILEDATQDNISPLVIDAPNIQSKELIDENSWISGNKITFNWEVPYGVTGVQLLYGRKPDSTPSVMYAPPVASKTLENLKDGTWYFFARFKTAQGFSPITRKQFNIDNSAPKELAISADNTPDDLVMLKIEGKDEGSGLSKYIVDLDGGTIIEEKAQNLANGDFLTLPPISGGSHNLSVRAYDKAGNGAEKSLVINAPETKNPVIESIKSKVSLGEKMEISGNAFYPNVTVRIYVQQEGKEPASYDIASEIDGKFVFKGFSPSIAGNILIWAQTIRTATVISQASEKMITVAKGGFASNFNVDAPNVLWIIIPFFLITFILIGILYYDLYKFKHMKRILNRDLEQTRSEVSKVLEIVQNDVKSSQKLIKKASSKRQQAMKDLTLEEERILAELEKNIEAADKYFQEKIKYLEEKGKQ